MPRPRTIRHGARLWSAAPAPGGPPGHQASENVFLTDFALVQCQLPCKRFALIFRPFFAACRPPAHAPRVQTNTPTLFACRPPLFDSADASACRSSPCPPLCAIPRRSVLTSVPSVLAPLPRALCHGARRAPAAASSGAASARPALRSKHQPILLRCTPPRAHPHPNDTLIPCLPVAACQDAWFGQMPCIARALAPRPRFSGVRALGCRPSAKLQAPPLPAMPCAFFRPTARGPPAIASSPTPSHRPHLPPRLVCCAPHPLSLAAHPPPFSTSARGDLLHALAFV